MQKVTERQEIEVTRGSVVEKTLSRSDFLKLSGAGFAGAISLGVMGCGGGGQDGKTLTYWASQSAPTIEQDKQILGKAVKEFKKQTGITVNIKVIGWADLWNRITTAVSSGQGPDVLNIGNTWSPSLQATGAFLPFDQERINAIGGKDEFVSSALKATGMPGKTPTSVPVYGLAYGLYYNKALFKEGGMKSAPKTWSEFLAIAKKLTKPPKQWGFVVEGASITEGAHWTFFLSQQHGGALFDKSGKPTFDSPENVRAVKQYVDFMAKDKIVAPQAVEYSTGTQAISDFANNKAAMLIWSNAGNALRSVGMKESQLGVAIPPILDPLPPGGNPIVGHVAGINLSIFNNTQNEDGALKFIKFMTSKEQQVQLNRVYGSLPIIKAASKDPAFNSEEDKVLSEVLAKYSAPMPLIPDEGQMETLIGGAVKNLFAKAALTGKISEKDVRSELAEANQKMAASGTG